MATQDNPADAPVDIDDLLNLTGDDEKKVVSESTSLEDLLAEGTGQASDPVPVGETPDQARIRALQEELAKPAPQYSVDEPVEKTPEQIQIQELEDQLARRKSQELENAPAQYVTAKNGNTLIIHVLIDGFIAMGEVWYRGQEMEFEVGGLAYERTKDRLGTSWVDLAGDVSAQYTRWGQQYLGVGPFLARPGEKFEDEVAQADKKRGRAVPLVRG